MKTEIDWRLVALKIISAPSVFVTLQNFGGLPACGLSDEESAACAAELYAWGWRPPTPPNPGPGSGTSAEPLATP